MIFGHSCRKPGDLSWAEHLMQNQGCSETWTASCNERVHAGYPPLLLLPKIDRTHKNYLTREI